MCKFIFRFKVKLIVMLPGLAKDLAKLRQSFFFGPQNGSSLGTKIGKQTFGSKPSENTRISFYNISQFLSFKGNTKYDVHQTHFFHNKKCCY